LNLRTYVVAGGKPGVWFFSLDAASLAAVRCARRFYHLPYRDARITCSATQDGWIDYRCRRCDSRHPAAEFSARYRPLGESEGVAADPLATWLTARYCLYSADRHGRVWRAEIDHAPWPLQDASAAIRENTLGDWLGIAIEGPPQTLHFAKSLDVHAWWPERL